MTAIKIIFWCESASKSYLILNKQGFMIWEETKNIVML